MSNKGVNTLILESKENLIEAINNCIRSGIPAAMVSIIVESLLNDLAIETLSKIFKVFIFKDNVFFLICSITLLVLNMFLEIFSYFTTC